MDTHYYKSQLLAHYKKPQGRGEITSLHKVANGVNPLCGDEISVGVILDGQHIKDIKFNARACSICIASSSIMVEVLTQQETSQIEYYYEQIKKLLNNEVPLSEVDESLQALSSIVASRSRHKCACLAWDALLEVVNN